MTTGQRVAAREGQELRAAGHRAVVVHDLAQDAARREAGKPGQVDRSLGLAAALEHAARAGPQGEDMAGPDEIGGPVAGSTATWIVRARSAAEIPVVTPVAASIETQKPVASLPFRARHHERQVELVAALLGEREADQAARLSTP